MHCTEHTDNIDPRYGIRGDFLVDYTLTSLTAVGDRLSVCDFLPLDNIFPTDSKQWSATEAGEPSQKKSQYLVFLTRVSFRFDQSMGDGGRTASGLSCSGGLGAPADPDRGRHTEFD